jgi:hypothetical protein
LHEDGRRDRFLTRSMMVWLAVYALFALTYMHFQIQGDALVYFNMMRRFFGEHPDFAFAYQFGSDVWNTPFYLVGRLFGAIFGLQPRIFHVSFEEIWITIGAQVGFVLTLYLAWRLLRGLRLPATANVIFVSAIGTPTFYYFVFEPAMKQAADTLYIMAGVLLLLRIFTGGGDRYVLGLGALAGISMITRYVNAAFFLAIAIAFALTDRRALKLATAAALVVGGLVFALPALRGIGYYLPSYFPSKYALGAGWMPVASTSNPLNGFDPLVPFKMLFSDHRGLFVWTPLTVFGAVGYGLLLRREQDPARRRFLWTLLAAAFALLVAHSPWAEWDGAYSFSTRFLTALFPLFLIGIAELVRRFGSIAYVPLALCIAWSFMLMLVHVVGYDNITARDPASAYADHFFADPGAFLEKGNKLGHKRWRYVSGLFRGEDSEHIHGR